MQELEGRRELAARDEAQLHAVGLGEGAVATSSRLRRRWSVDGQPRHHLIDPRAGHPVEGEVASVTVVAALGWQAEVLAKAAFIGGAVQGLEIGTNSPSSNKTIPSIR